MMNRRLVRRAGGPASATARPVAAVLGFAAISAILLAPSSARADTVFEIGDAGSFPTNAQPAILPNPVTEIVGSITPSDADLYQIFISDPSIFSAAGVSTGTNTQLFLFDSNGYGVAASGSFTPAPQLPQGDALYAGLPSGVYYLGIADRYNPQGVQGSVFESIFPSGPGVVGPTGLGGASPLEGWLGGIIHPGDPAVPYAIQLTGVGAAAPPEVPDPGALASAVVMSGSLAGALARGRLRRRHPAA